MFSQSWDLYTESKNKHVKTFVRVLQNTERNFKKRKKIFTKSDVLLLN